MKKLLLSTLCLAALGTQAQFVFTEDFSSADALDGWTMYGTDGATLAGDVAGFGLSGSTFWAINSELVITTTWFTAAADADNYLITPAIDLLSEETTLNFKAESFGSAAYLDPYEVRISTTGTDKADFTTVIHENTAGAPNSGGEEISLTLDATFEGETVYIAFVATGNDDYILGFDNISIEQDIPNDIQLVSVDLPEYVVAGEVAISGTVRNNGVNDITSFTIDWNDGTSHSETFTATIAPGATYDFTHGTTLSAVAGTDYTIDVCADITGDMFDNNNCIEKSFGTATGTADRLALIELFTSSTCPPCYGLNYTLFDGSGLNAALEAENANDPTDAELAIIKYQVNWPGSGDHSYNSEVGTRVANYGITGAPSIILDGAEGPGFTTFNSTHTDAQKDIPSYFGIEAIHSSTDGVITVDVEVNPFLSVSGTRLFIALLDKGYDAGDDASFSNGETEFHHVFRKMLPNASGEAVGALTAGTAYTTSHTYEYSHDSEYPEQGSFKFHDSEQEVVVFLVSADGEVLNSTISTGSVENRLASVEENNVNFEISMYPNPASAETFVSLSTVETADVTIEIYNLLGEVVYTMTENNKPAGKFNYTIDVANFTAGMYTVKTTVNGQNSIQKLSVN